jgi:alpha-L-fucosidase
MMSKIDYTLTCGQFSPAYAPFGFSSWPGGNATNPFTNVTLPYTGFVPVENYVDDVIMPEMRTLAGMVSSPEYKPCSETNIISMTAL